MKLKKLLATATIISAFVFTGAYAEVVNLSNGDRITGRILRTDETNVVLETAFGTIPLPRNMVVGISTDSLKESKLEQSLASQQAEAQTRAAAPEKTETDEKYDPAANDETAPEAKERELEWVVAYRNFMRENLPEGWQFRLRGGLEYRSTSSSVMSAYAAFDTIKEWNLNKFSATAYYNYTKQTSAENVTDVTLDKYGVDTAYRRDFNESRHWYFQNILNYKRDTVKGIRDQVDEAATFGYRFDFKRYNLIIDIAPGPAVRYINADNYDTKWVAMAVLAENIQWKISTLLRFEQNGYLGFNLQDPQEYSANLGLGLILKATDVMEIALRYSYSYDAINASSNQLSEQTLLLSFEFPFNWKY